jgi:hypothetical protein
MEVIKEIKGSDEDGRSGYIIVTDKQEIKLLIDNGQSCCEQWGYFMSEDDLSYFEGSDFVELVITDTALSEAKMIENDCNNIYEGGVMFVDIKTSKGVLQFVAYNQHNGWYGHGAYIISRDLNHEETL